MSNEKLDKHTEIQEQEEKEQDTMKHPNATESKSTLADAPEAPDFDVTIGQLRSRIEELERERDDLKDKYLRKAAEFENYKRRIEQDIAAWRKYSNEELLVDLLPIIDDFERSLHVSKERREFGTFYKGMELIYEKLKKLLQSKGVTPIESIGKEFDVKIHDALMQIPKDNTKPNTVVEEVEKGYMYKDKVLRHAKVIVATDPTHDNSSEGEPSIGNANKEENG